jgi:hypothetical protein
MESIKRRAARAVNPKHRATSENIRAAITAVLLRRHLPVGVFMDLQRTWNCALCNKGWDV